MKELTLCYLVPLVVVLVCVWNVLVRCILVYESILRENYLGTMELCAYIKA